MKQYYKNRTVLVTGGAGFIGSHLVEKLLAQGACVTVLDNLSTGTKANLQSVMQKITFLQGSITDFDVCLQATKGQEIIFHLAACVAVQDSMCNPYECHATNITGTLHVLEAARQQHIKKLIFSSSCAVYGDQPSPWDEAVTCNPISPYGFSKLAGEELCKHYAKQFDMQTICLRYFNVYGERQNHQGPYAAVVARFSTYMQQNQPVIIYGDGLQTRDFVPVEEVVQANLAVGILESTTQTEIYNIATGTSISLLNLIERLKQHYPHFNAGIIFLPARKGDIVHVQAQSEKYKKLLEQHRAL